MNRKLRIFIPLFFLPVLCWAQSREEIMQDQARFVYGEGAAFTLQEAKDIAMKDLISKIQVSIVNETSNEKSKTAGTDGTESRADFSSSLTTYSHASLVGLRSILVKNEPDAEFFYYIPVENIDKMFENRRNKVEAFMAAADAELRQGKIDAALRDYFWADALLGSLRYPEEVTVYEEDRPMPASIWLPRKIESVLSGISATYLRKSASNENAHELFFTYGGEPVSSLEISYMDGTQWFPCSVTDGLALIELPPEYNVPSLSIRYEYCFENTIGNDEDVQAVLKVLKFRPNRSAYTTVDIQGKTKKVTAEHAPIASARTLATLEQGVTDEKSLDRVMAQITDAIRRKDYESPRDLFADDGYDIFKRLISYGNGTIIGTPSYSYLSLGDETFCRSVPMGFSFPGQRKFVEDVVFTFNKDKKVTNICFGLGKEAARTIYEHEGEWTRESRIIIVNFLENYKTAYALERLDYIESIFADDALIISGKVVYRTETADGYKNNKYVEKTQKDKQTYLHDLKQIFSANSFINIKFSNCDILKMKYGGEVYGIQIKQDYYSSRYSDTGFLYLHVDVNDPHRPIIHVRAWQEDYDPEWGLVGPDMF